jgi:hypothetical protein
MRALVALSLGCGRPGLEPTSAAWSPPPAGATAGELRPREDCDHRVEERQALFGDLHIHTGVSMDANSTGTSTVSHGAR